MARVTRLAGVAVWVLETFLQDGNDAREHPLGKFADQFAEATRRARSLIRARCGERHNDALHKCRQDFAQRARRVEHHRLPDVQRSITNLRATKVISVQMQGRESKLRPYRESDIRACKIDGRQDFSPALLAQRLEQQPCLRLGANALVVAAGGGLDLRCNGGASR